MAEARVKGHLEISGLGQSHEFPFNAATGTAPTATHYNYRQQATVDTPEALDLGSVSTVHMLVIKAKVGTVSVDLDFVSAFDADLVIPLGETAVIPKPSGTIYVSNGTSNVQATYEYWVAGV